MEGFKSSGSYVRFNSTLLTASPIYLKCGQVVARVKKMKQRTFGEKLFPFCSWSKKTNIWNNDAIKKKS